MKLRRVGLPGFLSFGLAVGLVGCIDDGGPTLLSLSASAGQAGLTIELNGIWLCGALDDCSAATGSVTFDDVTAHAAPIVGVTPTTLRVVVPPMSPGNKRVVAIVDGVASNALIFEVVP